LQKGTKKFKLFNFKWKRKNICIYFWWYYWWLFYELLLEFLLKLQWKK